MYTLFETSNPNRTPLFYYQGFDSVRRRWRENIIRLQGHWRTSGYAVKSEHVLSRLVGSFSIPLYSDVRKYRDAILDLTPRLCMGNGIVSPTNGTINQINPGWFYGLKDREYLVSVSEDFNPVTAADNWETLEPLKVLRHTLTDLNMALPNGDVQDVADGYVIITINIPMLAVQYWGWQRNQLETAKEGSAERNQQFIGQYVLPSLLSSQTTVAFFNRLLGTLNKVPVSEERRVNTLAIATNYTNVDRSIAKILSDFSTHRLTYPELFACIPTVDTDSFLRFMQTPDMVIGRQNQWALEAAYIPYTSFALNLTAAHGNDQNQQERNVIWRLIKRIESDRIFDAAPRSCRDDLRLDFNAQVGTWIV